MACAIPARCSMPLENFRSCTSAAAAKSHAVKKSGHALAPFGRAVIRKPRVIIEQLARRQVIVEIGLLGQVADVAVHAPRRQSNGRERAPFRRWKDQPHQELQRGGFSGAVRSEKSEHFALLYLKREVIERAAHPFAPEADGIILREPENFNGRSTHGIHY